MQKSTENLHTDFKVMNTGFAVVKDKVAICQADVAQLVKLFPRPHNILFLEQAMQLNDE
jgi:hypothetical protein